MVDSDTDLTDLCVFVDPARAGALTAYVAGQADPCAAPAGVVLVAQTAHAAVYAQQGSQSAATAVAGAVEQDYSALAAIFGLEPPGLPFTVYVQPGVGGAYHCGCAATTFFVDADPQLGGGFFAAEAVEVFEAAIGNGWDCGATNGEALSRVLAASLHSQLGTILVPTEVGWWNDGAANYVSDNGADDRNADANGCGTLFLYYLHDGLGHGWDAITRAGGASLAATYAALSGDGAGNAFNAYMQALQPFVDANGNLNLPASGNPWASGASGASGASA